MRYDTAQRNRRFALLAVATTVLAFWIFVVIWIGSLGGAEPARETVPAPAATESSTPGAATAEGAGSGISRRAAPASGSGDPENPDGGVDGDEASGGAAPGGSPGAARGGEELPRSASGPGEHPEAEPLDPLGRNPEPGDLTETDRERAGSAAERFVTAAYGYTGDSDKEYLDGVVRTSFGLGLFDSPGGERIREYARGAGEQGIASAARMQRFEIMESSPGRVEGVVYFHVGEEYDRYAGIEGEKTLYRQELTLSPYGESYRVSAASVEEEVERKDGDRGGEES